METGKYIKSRQDILNKELGRLLPGINVYPQSIRKAMRYSIFAGGKRIRPLLCLAACESFGGHYKKALPFACAIEMIHTYSLIHDDLPALDNDDLRRGLPTNHKVFGEAMAILAGDALLTMAFKVTTGKEAVKYAGSDRALRITHEIANYAGIEGMVGGQVADIESENKRISAGRIRFIHMNKTAALITASVRAGAIAGECKEKVVEKLTYFGENVGLAFQITDDILNIEGDQKITGKSVGSDAKLGKATYPSAFGLEKSKKIALNLKREAMNILDSLKPDTLYLKEITEIIVTRKS